MREKETKKNVNCHGGRKGLRGKGEDRMKKDEEGSGGEGGSMPSGRHVGVCSQDRCHGVLRIGG